MVFHQHLEKNPHGEDFIIGDIHGDKEKFLQALASVDFNPEKDRLFSLGDLIDRGDNNQYVLELLKNDWFFAIRGNHEQMILNCFDSTAPSSYMGPNVRNTEEARLFHQLNGGQWYWETCDHIERNEICQKLNTLPFAMTLETQQGSVGLVHAEVPQGQKHWQYFVENLANDEMVRNDALWNREKIKFAFNQPSELACPNQADQTITGVLATVHGHTGVHTPINYGNQIWIDTGYLHGSLTILNAANLNYLT